MTQPSWYASCEARLGGRGVPAGRSLGRDGRLGRLSAVQPELIELAHWPRRNTRQHVLEIRKRVHAVPLARGHQTGRRRPGPPPRSFPRKRESRTRPRPRHYGAAKNPRSTPRTRQGAPRPPVRRSRASGNPRQGGLSRHSRASGKARRGRPRAGGGRDRWVPGASVWTPAFAGVTIRGMMGRQGRQRGPPRHSRASGNPEEVGSARPSPPRTIAHLRPHPRKSEVAKTRRGSRDAYDISDGQHNDLLRHRQNDDHVVGRRAGWGCSPWLSTAAS